MSYFGKKSLIWWDYEDHTKENALRYIHTNEELQLNILKKWYPKSMLFMKKNDDSTYRVENYKLVNHAWLVEYQKEVYNKIHFDTINPVLILPLPESVLPLKRGYRLDRILKSIKYPLEETK